MAAGPTNNSQTESLPGGGGGGLLVSLSSLTSSEQKYLHFFCLTATMAGTDRSFDFKGKIKFVLTDKEKQINKDHPPSSPPLLFSLPHLHPGNNFTGVLVTQSTVFVCNFNSIKSDFSKRNSDFLVICSRPLKCSNVDFSCYFIVPSNEHR